MATKKQASSNECMTLNELWDFISDNRQTIFGSFRMASMHEKVCVVHAGEKHPLIQHIRPEWQLRKDAAVYMDPSKFEDPRSYAEFEKWVNNNNPNNVSVAVEQDTAVVDQE